MTASKVVVTGAEGQLGRQLVAAFEAAEWAVIALGHADFDIDGDRARDKSVFGDAAVVINAAAWTDVDGCARDPERALRINGSAAGRIAGEAAALGALVVQISTNEVFDGTSDRPYRELDQPNPINAYGASKLAGEQSVARANPRHLIIRTAWIFGPGGRNFPSKITEVAMRQRAAGEALRVVVDEVGNPTWAPDLAAAVKSAVEAFLDGRLAAGVLHLCGEPPTSRFEWAMHILTDVSGVSLVPINAAEFSRASQVPLRAVLATDKARILGIGPLDWVEATRRYVAALATEVA